MIKIKYPGSEEISIELPYFFKKGIENEHLPMEDDIYGRVEGCVITILQFIYADHSVRIKSKLWHPDQFPALDFGNPFTDCQQIDKKEFETAQLRAAKMLRII